MKVRDDKRRFDELAQQLGDLGDRAAYVGVFEGSGSSNGVGIVELAAIHEFGLGKMPERSFLRAWVDRNADAIAETMTKQVQQATAKGASPEVALQRVAQWGAGQVQKFISSRQVRPPSKKATNDRKGSSTTLIDSGSLRQAIKGKVL